MDDRSERLRKRRNQSMEGGNRRRNTDGSESLTTDETGETSPSEGSETSGSDRDDGPAMSNESTSIKEKQTGTYMYLPDSQTKKLRRLYNVLKAEYEFQYDQEFEKNRHFYPLVIQVGLDGLESMDTSEVRKILREGLD